MDKIPDSSEDILNALPIEIKEMIMSSKKLKRMFVKLKGLEQERKNREQNLKLIEKEFINFITKKFDIDLMPNKRRIDYEFTIKRLKDINAEIQQLINKINVKINKLNKLISTKIENNRNVIDFINTLEI